MATHQAERDLESRGSPADRRSVRSPSGSRPRQRSTQRSSRTHTSVEDRTWSEDPSSLQRTLGKFPSSPVAVDLETKGLHPHASEEAAVGAIITEVAGKKFIFREFPDWWPEFLADADTPKVMHNAKFDLAWMIEHCEDGVLHAQNIQDTMLKSQLVHDYRTRSGSQKAGNPLAWKPNDLKSVLAEQLGVEIKKEIDHEQTDWTGPWSDEMIEYMLEDIGHLATLNEVLDKKLHAEGQEQASWIEQNAVFATAWMTVNGIKPDVSSWHASIEDWKDQHHVALLDLQELWPGVDNFNSPKQLVESSAQVLGSPLPNTKKATLKQLSADFPPVQKLLEQRHLATRLKNWGPHYLDSYLCSICSRFHPGWNQIGTETSRPSCNRPNLLQIPRAADFRALFVAEEGHLIASLDYSAIEVLVAGVFANEPRLIEACATGDPHLQTARMISQDYDMIKADPRRQHAKIANFGLLFGGGRDGLITQARDLFDTHLSVPEATMMMEQYFRLYPGLQRTKNLAYRAMESKEDRITLINKCGFRRYLEGFNRKPTSWLNTWIQSTAAFGMKMSFYYLQKAGLTPFVLGQVYDEVLFEFPWDRAHDFAAEAKACMVRGMKDVLGENIPVPVSIDIGRSWS